MTITDAALDERLSRADRAGDRAPDTDVLRALAARTRAEARRRSLRGRILGAAAATTLVIGLVISAPATADGIRWLVTGSPIALQMNRFIHGDGSTEIVRESEFVDLGAGDLPDYIASRWEEWLPLAPGQSKQEIIDEVVRGQQHALEAAKVDGAPGALTQEVGFRRQFEVAVYDAWLREWFRAHRAGDAAAESAAIEVLQAAPKWPALVATDGGGITAVMQTFADRLAAGDLEAAQVLAEFEQLPEWDGVTRFETSIAPVICADLAATGKGACDD